MTNKEMMKEISDWSNQYLEKNKKYDRQDNLVKEICSLANEWLYNEILKEGSDLNE